MNKSEDPNNQGKVQKDILWGLYIELRNQARHSEILRSSVNNYVLLISSTLITISTFDKEINGDDLPLALILILVGAIGTIFSFSYTERYDRNRARALQIIKHIDAHFFEGKAPLTLNSLNIQADGKHYEINLYRWVRKITSTHWFWVMLPITVFFIGLILTGFSYFDI